LKRFLVIIVALLLTWGSGRGQGLVKDIAVPKGFAAIEYPVSSYSRWLATRPLKTNNVILAHDGQTIAAGTGRIFAVLDLPLLFTGDLEQCADYAMRLWAEYHKDRNKLDKLYLFDYNGRRQYYLKSGLSYRSFLRRAFANSNSYSLKKGCATVDTSAIVPGDMVVQNERGGVGHVSVVMNACRDSSGQKLYLIGFSYMPAQEFHIERALEGYGAEGWFSLEGYYRYLRDYMDLGTPVLRRFN
jgi:hypothetical protein